MNATPAYMSEGMKGVENFLATLRSDRKPEQHMVRDHTSHVSSASDVSLKVMAL